MQLLSKLDTRASKLLTKGLVYSMEALWAHKRGTGSKVPLGHIQNIQYKSNLILFVNEKFDDRKYL